MTARTFTFPVTSSLPSYIPAAGSVAVLKKSTGQLTNTFGSVMPAWYSAFYGVKIVNDYSGGIVNPHYGTFGALVFEGGGHSATNNNSVIQLEFGASTASFRCIVPGTNYWPTAYENDVKSDSSPYANSWGEYPDGKPAARHSYAAQDILGPTEGGATCGTFVRLLDSTLGQAGYGLNGVGSVGLNPHKIDFGTVGATYSWARWGTQGGWTSNPGVPYWSAFVASQKRIYVVYKTLASVQWFDTQTNTWATGSGTSLTQDYDVTNGSPDGQAMFCVPARNLLVFADAKGGVLRIRTLDVTQSNPSWSAARTLSSSLALAPRWSSGAWCADTQKIIVGSELDTAAVHEIDIPADLNSTWTVTRAPFPGGQTLPFTSGSISGFAYKQWSYNPRTKCFAYFPLASAASADDTVYLYRPRNT